MNALEQAVTARQAGVTVPGGALLNAIHVATRAADRDMHGPDDLDRVLMHGALIVAATDGVAAARITADGTGVDLPPVTFNADDLVIVGTTLNAWLSMGPAPDATTLRYEATRLVVVCGDSLEVSIRATPGHPHWWSLIAKRLEAAPPVRQTRRGVLVQRIGGAV